MGLATRRGRERLRERLPHDPVVRVERARWGFATPTRILALASSRRVVLQLVPIAAARRAPEGARVLRGAGLPVPELLAELHRTGRACLIWEFVNGTTGASLMDGDQARSLAGAMGRAQGEIQAIRDAAIPVDEAWRGPHDLRVAARRWQAAAGTTDTASALRAIVDRIAEQEWTPVVTHGDFVPANVLVADGDISAILDLGDVAMRHPLVDAAWWSLIVAHHHGSDHHHLETAYLAAAGLPTTSEERRRLADVAAIRALQLAAAQSSGPPIRRLLAAAIGRAARPAGAEGHSATHSSPGE